MLRYIVEGVFSSLNPSGSITLPKGMNSFNLNFYFSTSFVISYVESNKL